MNKPSPAKQNDGANVSDKPLEDAAVATSEQNAALEHTDGGTTTRDDKNDLGVPMLPGSPNEKVGPEDALGEGPTRGDYRSRIGSANYHPHSGGVPQRPNAEIIGDVPGKKGGVETAGESGN